MNYDLLDEKLLLLFTYYVLVTVQGVKTCQKFEQQIVVKLRSLGISLIQNSQSLRELAFEEIAVGSLNPRLRRSKYDEV